MACRAPGSVPPRPKFLPARSCSTCSWSTCSDAAYAQTRPPTAHSLSAFLLWIESYRRFHRVERAWLEHRSIAMLWRTRGVLENGLRCRHRRHGWRHGTINAGLARLCRVVTDTVTLEHPVQGRARDS